MADLTIATPFAGYELPYLDRWLEHLRDLCICADPAEVLWLDNSLSPMFGEYLLDASTTIPAPVRILEERLKIADPATAKADLPWEAKEVQASLMWQRARLEVETEWILCLESDVIPPPNTVELLGEALASSPPVGAISGTIPERPHRVPNAIVPMVWRMRIGEDTTIRGLPEPGLHVPAVDRYLGLNPDCPRDGMEIVDGIPFGCMLSRRSTLLSVPLEPTWPPCNVYGSDQLFSRNLRKLRKLHVAVHWGVRCGHIKKMPDGTFEDLRNVTHIPTD